MNKCCELYVNNVIKPVEELQKRIISDKISDVKYLTKCEDLLIEKYIELEKFLENDK